MIRVYEKDDIVLLQGNCQDFLPTATADHIITDPPYDSRTHFGVRNPLARVPLVVDFDPLDVAQVLPHMLRVSRRWTICFCSMEMLGTYNALSGDAWIRAGFWRRPNGAPQFSGDRPAQPGEGIAIMHRPFSLGREGRTRWNRGGHHAYWEFPVVQRGRLHPTQKPLDLMVALIQAFTDPGDLILDPFVGSGTTLLAARQTGRRAIGIEVDSKTCEVAYARLTE